MKRIATTFVLIFGFILSYSQIVESNDSIIADSTFSVVTDFKSIIYSVVSDTASNFHYPKLENKARDNKSELTVEDCYYLYYGQLFKSTHKGLPFLAPKERMEFDKIVAKGNKKKIIELGVRLLDSNPVDLTILLHTCKCMQEKNDERCEAYTIMFTRLLDAIFSEGTGQSPKNAIKVIDIEDEYVLKGVLGFLGGTEGLGADEEGNMYNVWTKGEQKLYFKELFFEDIKGLKLK